MSSLEQKKYPIGQFVYGKTYSAKDVKDAIEDIENLPKQLKKTLKKLKGEEIDTPYRPGGWTVRQVIHHMADSHMNAYIRMKLAATEKTPQAKTYEEGLWAELADGKTASAKLSIKLLTALHKRWVVFLKNCSLADLKRGYFSPGAGRILTIEEAVALYSWHGRHHVSHIKLLTGWEPAASGETAEKADGKAQSVEAMPKIGAKRGPKPKVKTAETAPVAKRLRRTKEQIAADLAAKAAAPKMTKGEALAKARATAAANRAANMATAKPIEKAAKTPKAKAAPAPKPTVTGKRARRTKDQIAADLAAAAAAKAAKPPMDKVAQMAKARAVAAANRAAKGIATKAAKPAPDSKRTRRTKDQIAADLAAAAAAKAAKPPMDKVAQMAKARAVAAANRAAKGIVPKQKKEAPTGPKMTKAEALAKGRATAAANRAAKGIVPKAKKAASDGPKMTKAEALAKGRATAAANRAAKGIVPKAKKATDGPKLTQGEALAKARAVAAANRAAKGIVPKAKKAAPADGAPKRKGMTAERMARIRAMRGKKKE